ncbi:hypothetical protein EDB83DRAFT_2365902 [Lactarius deliciosus]|nr:hypothetical protein EDB83DRAFT_2365902 [Lactarius deliciosus]
MVTRLYNTRQSLCSDGWHVRTLDHVSVMGPGASELRPAENSNPVGELSVCEWRFVTPTRKEIGHPAKSHFCLPGAELESPRSPHHMPFPMLLGLGNGPRIVTIRWRLVRVCVWLTRLLLLFPQHDFGGVDHSNRSMATVATGPNPRRWCCCIIKNFHRPMQTDRYGHVTAQRKPECDNGCAGGTRPRVSDSGLMENTSCHGGDGLLEILGCIRLPPVASAFISFGFTSASKSHNKRCEGRDRKPIMRHEQPK